MTVFNDAEQMYNNSVVVPVEGIVLRCFSSAGNGNLTWRSSNADLQERIMSSSDGMIGRPYNLRITTTSNWKIDIEALDGVVTEELVGRYDCVSRESGVFSSVDVVQGAHGDWGSGYTDIVIICLFYRFLCQTTI